MIIVCFHIMLLFRHKTPHQQKDDTTILSKSVEPVKTFQINLSRNNSRDSSDTGSDVTLQGVMLSGDGKSHDTSHDTSHDPEQTPTIDNGTGGAANGEIAQPPAQTIAASVSAFKCHEYNYRNHNRSEPS